MNDHFHPGRILIVADDLTGACDAAAPFVHYGRRATVRCDLVQHNTRSPDVLSVCTQSRADEARVAGKKVARVGTAWYQHANDYFIKKIDSTLKGNVASEIEAMLNCLPAEIAIVAPAFPEQGRTLRNGVLHVHGAAEGEINLPELLKQQTSLAVKQLRRDQLRMFVADCRIRGTPTTVGQKQVCVCDALDPADMDCIAEIVAQLGSRALTVGSSGITQRLAQKWAGGQIDQVPTNTAVKAFIVVAGSRQPATLRQIQHLVSTRDGGCLSIENSADIDAIRPGRGPLVIQIPCEIPEHHALVELPNRLNAIGPVRLLLTGGDTAQWLFDVSEAESVTVLGEFETGIPFGEIRGGKLDGFPVITKAGGFGTLDTLTSAYDRFREAA